MPVDPNQIARNPSDMRPTYDGWAGRIIQDMVRNIANGPSTAGYPATWNQGSWATDIGKDSASVSAYTVTQIAAWLNTVGKTDPDIIATYGSPPPVVKVETPEETAARIAREHADRSYALQERNQELNEAKFYIGLAASQAGQGQAGNVRFSTGGGGGGGGGGAYSANALDQAKLALESEIARGQLDLDRLRHNWNQEYQTRLIGIQEREIGERARQFDQQSQFAREQFEYQKGQDQADNALKLWQAQNERAAHVAKLQSDPGDFVQRQFFLHGQASPLGTPVDLFTGQKTGAENSMTFEQVAQQNAPMTPLFGVNPTGATAPPPIGQPGQPPVPAAAQGTPGYTTAPLFIAGDHPSGDMSKGRPELIQNPTQAPIRVLNNPQTKQAMGLFPRFAEGTAISSQDWQAYHDQSVAANEYLYGRDDLESQQQPELQYANDHDTLGQLVGTRTGYGNEYPVYYDPNNRSYTPVAADGTPLWSWSSVYSNGYDPNAPLGGVNPAGSVDYWFQPPTPDGQTSAFDRTMTTTQKLAAGWQYDEAGRLRPPVPANTTPSAGSGATPTTAPTVDSRVEQGGFRKITSDGRITGGPSAPNAHILVRAGDYLGRNDPVTGAPTVWRWDATSSQYYQVPYNLDSPDQIISSSTQWNQLPWETRQAVLDNKRFDYLINDMGSFLPNGRTNPDGLTPDGRVQTPGWFAGWRNWTAGSGPEGYTGGFVNNASMNVTSPYGNQGLMDQRHVPSAFSGGYKPEQSPLSWTGLFRLDQRRADVPGTASPTMGEMTTASPGLWRGMQDAGPREFGATEGLTGIVPEKSAPEMAMAPPINFPIRPAPNDVPVNGTWTDIYGILHWNRGGEDWWSPDNGATWNPWFDSFGT